MTAHVRFPDNPHFWLNVFRSEMGLSAPTRDDLYTLLNLLPLFIKFEVRPEEVVQFYDDDPDWLHCALKARERLSPKLRYNVVPFLMVFALVNFNHCIFQATETFTDDELEVFATCSGFSRY